VEHLTALPILVAELQLDLTESGPSPRAAGHEDHVVIELRQLVVLVISKDKPLTGRFEDCELPERLAPDDTAQNPSRVTRKLVIRPRPAHFGPFQRPPRGGVRQFQGPDPFVLCTSCPMAQRHSLLPEPTVRRVEIPRDELFFWKTDRATHERAQVRQRQSDRCFQLDFPFKGGITSHNPGVPIDAMLTPRYPRAECCSAIDRPRARVVPCSSWIAQECPCASLPGRAGHASDPVRRGEIGGRPDVQKRCRSSKTGSWFSTRRGAPVPCSPSWPRSPAPLSPNLRGPSEQKSEEHLQAESGESELLEQIAEISIVPFGFRFTGLHGYKVGQGSRERRH